jgi:hypothetical protein
MSNITKVTSVQEFDEVVQAWKSGSYDPALAKSKLEVYIR